MDTKCEILNYSEVRKAIRFDNPKRPPLCAMLWHNQDTLDYYGKDFSELLERYPDDVLAVHIGIHYWQSHKSNDENYRWAYRGWEKPQGSAIDNCPIIKDWQSDLPKFIKDMPDPCRGDAFDEVAVASKAYPERYILVNWGTLSSSEALLYQRYGELALRYV